MVTTADLAPLEAPLRERSFDDLLAEAVRFHGHLCPGQVLGVRMVLAGCREIGLEQPRRAGKGLVVFVEIDRCATDAIQALTGVSLGKRTLKHVDYGKMAATFVDVARRAAVRVVARDAARALVPGWAAGESDPCRAQIAAYRVMPEPELLRIDPVTVNSGWLDRPRVRVPCDACGEEVNYGRRVVIRGGGTLCRACAGGGYCRPA
jgi:formylmethanofuran dehydrogenase subunit E